MKKSLCAILAALLMITLAACGSGSDDSGGDDLIVVGFSQVGSESEWRVANTENMKSVLCEENGYQLIFDDAQQKKDNQILAIRNFIQQKVDYLIVAPVTESGWDSLFAEVREAGIPLILLDRMVTLEDPTLYTAFVGSNFRYEGDRAVAWLDNFLTSRGRTEEKINIVHIQGTMSSSPQIGRTAALEEALTAHKNWRIIAQETGDFTRSKAYEVMRDVLQTTHDIDVVYCENDGEALGAIDAIEEAGLKCGPDGIIIISFDATRAGLQQCIDGKICVNIECNAIQGGHVDEVIKALEKGEEIEKDTYVTGEVFDCFTITEEMIAGRAY